jgi:hypothetical protein
MVDVARLRAMLEHLRDFARFRAELSDRITG